MGLLGIFEWDILNISKILAKTGHIQKVEYDEKEQLQNLLNNMSKYCVSPVDTTVKSAESNRVNEPEVQEAIKKFNSLPKEQRDIIFDLADNKLRDKLMNFMVQNEELSKLQEKSNSYHRTIKRYIDTVADKKCYNEAVIDSIASYCNLMINNSLKNADIVIKSFNEYKTGEKIGAVDVNIAIGQSERFKQTMVSYEGLLKSCIQNLKVSDESSKEVRYADLKNTVENLLSEISKYKLDSSEQMNAFIPEAVKCENQFYGMTKKYLTNDLPADLNLDNKVCENALIDALLEDINYTGAKLY